MGGAENNGGLAEKLESIAKEVSEVKVSVAALMPRGEIDGELSRRVSLDAYISDQGQVKDRLTKLEASPMKVFAAICAAGGCLSGLVGATGTIFGIVTWIVLQHH